MKLVPAARGSQEAGFTQPFRDRFALLSTFDVMSRYKDTRHGQHFRNVSVVALKWKFISISPNLGVQCVCNWTNQIVCFVHTLKISGDTSLVGPCLLSFYLVMSDVSCKVKFVRELAYFSQTDNFSIDCASGATSSSSSFLALHVHPCSTNRLCIGGLPHKFVGYASRAIHLEMK